MYGRKARILTALFYSIFSCVGYSLTLSDPRYFRQLTIPPPPPLYRADMSIFRGFADIRVFGLVLGHSCELSRSGLTFSSVWGGGRGVSLGPICIIYFLLLYKYMSILFPSVITHKGTSKLIVVKAIVHSSSIDYDQSQQLRILI